MENNVYKNIHDLPLTKIQNAAVKLMQSDLQFIYTAFINKEYLTPNYYIALMPYLGLIIDGIEDWVKVYNNSSKNIKFKAPIFTKSQETYYAAMRESIKLYDKGANHLNALLESKYDESQRYFSSSCKPLEKLLKFYDIYGVFSCNRIPCDNTILDQCFVPFFQYGKSDGEQIKNMAAIAGRYIVAFDINKSYTLDKNFTFSARDFGGFNESPFGNSYNVKFMLFSIMCQINFVIHAANNLIIEETPTKLRLSYLLYYYLCKIINSINDICKTSLILNAQYSSEIFRNAMAHYKLGMVLDECDIRDDYDFGLSVKILDTEYSTLRRSIIDELTNLSNQIKDIISWQ